MRSSMVLAVLAVLGGGCKKDPPPASKADDSTGPGKLESVPKPKKTDSPPPLPKPTHVLLMGHGDTDSTATFAAVDIADLGSVNRYTQPAVERKDWAKHYSALAAVGSGKAYHPVKRDGGWALAVRDLRAGKAAPEIELKVKQPVSSLMVVGDDLFVGAGMTLGRVSLNNGSYQVMVERKDGFGGKAYDLFARDGRMVVAIDDVVTPIWADLLWLEAGKWQREPWTLPSFINGTYRLAAVHFDDKQARDGALYAIGSYGIMSGSGHDLTRLAISGGKLQVKEGVVLNGGTHADPPVLEEHVDRGTDKVEKIIAGKDVTPWTGLALIKDKSGAVKELAIAAGSRGLLVVPVDFSPATKARVVDLGHVHDIANIGGQLVLLAKGTEAGVTKGTTRLHWLGPDLKIAKGVDVPGVYTRIIRDR